MKRIELYAHLYNEVQFLPLFLEHYSFVDKMTFFDNGSTDGSLELLKDFEVIQTNLPDFCIGSLMQIKNTVWKTSEYDLVIYPDIDEILTVEGGDLGAFLERTDYDIYQAQGFNMVYHRMPTTLSEVKLGILNPWYNKSLIFNPRIELEFLMGSHSIETSCENVSVGEVKLFHYQLMGVETILRKRQVMKERRSGLRYPPDYLDLKVIQEVLDSKFAIAKPVPDCFS